MFRQVSFEMDMKIFLVAIFFNFIPQTFCKFYYKNPLISFTTFDYVWSLESPHAFKRRGFQQRLSINVRGGVFNGQLENDLANLLDYFPLDLVYNRMWYQHDGAQLYIGRGVTWLNQTFNRSSIGRRGHVLCNLNPLDYFTQKFFEIMRFESCSNSTDLPIQLKRGRKLVNNYNNRSIELSLLVKEEIGGKIEGTIDLWKCGLTGSQSSCEYYVKDLKVRKVCEKLVMKDQLWSPFTNNITPSLECPLKANTYEVNCPFNNDIFRFMPVPTGVWKARGLLFSDDKTVLCIDFDGRVLERRV